MLPWVRAHSRSHDRRRRAPGCHAGRRRTARAHGRRGGRSSRDRLGKGGTTIRRDGPGPRGPDRRPPQPRAGARRRRRERDQTPRASCTRARGSSGRGSIPPGHRGPARAVSALSWTSSGDAGPRVLVRATPRLPSSSSSRRWRSGERGRPRRSWTAWDKELAASRIADRPRAARPAAAHASAARSRSPASVS